MAENNGTNGGLPKPDDSTKHPQVNVLGQYIKDLSFECPDATLSFRGPGKNPNLQINLNVQVRNLQDETFEVALSLEGEARSETSSLSMQGRFFCGTCHRKRFSPSCSSNALLFFSRSSGGLSQIYRAKGDFRHFCSTP